MRVVRPSAAAECLGLSLALLALLALIAPRPSSANCNVIPGTTNTFRAAMGELDRPFAMPGDFVELRVRPAVCDAASRGVIDHDGNATIDSRDVLVTVLFEPPAGGPKNAVVVARDCAALVSSLATCDAALSGTATCVEVPAADLVAISDPIASRVRFRFPDTDELVGTASDDRTLSGPATIAVTPSNLPLPCGALAAGRCADTGGLVACADELYPVGTCDTASAAVDGGFGHFVALPPPNNYEAVCETPGTPCDGTATEIHLTTDAMGNALIPWDYRGVLVRLDDVPVPRLVRGSTTLDAIAGGSFDPIQIPSNVFLSSWSPEGHRLPPIFTPLSDPSTPTATTLFGAIDAPVGVMRIARRACVSGNDAGRICAADSECPGSTCSAPLFEITDRYDAGVGPVVVDDSEYAVAAENPVPLDGLVETPSGFAFSVAEGLANQDLNGDGDQVDHVVTLRDHETGELLPIGPGGAPGRAVVRVRQGRFAFAAVEAQGDLVGFLESEPNQGYSDLNANGNVFDSILRVFRLGLGSATEVTTPAAPLTADASPLVGGRSIAPAGPYLFRTVEGAEATATTTRVSVSSADAQGNDASVLRNRSDWPAISADGRFVAFSSYASNLVVDDTNGAVDIFLHDRVTGSTVRVSTGVNGEEANGDSFRPSISADGRFIAFDTSARNLIPNGNGRDVMVYDRITGVTTRASTKHPSFGNTGNPNGTSYVAKISANGRFVVFLSTASNLILGDTTVSDTDAFVRDLELGVTTRVNVSSSGAQSSSGANWPAISGDGRFVVFLSADPNLVPNDTNGKTDVLLHDLATGVTTLMSVSKKGDQPPADSIAPAISGDGRLVSFGVDTNNLVPGDTNFGTDVFVKDRITGDVTRVNVSSSGDQAIFPSCGFSSQSISLDGRFVAFLCNAANLVPGDTNSTVDVFVHDLSTGNTVRVNVGANGTQSTVEAVQWPAISSDGQTVAFVSEATDLVAGDTNGFSDVFVRGPAPDAPAADRTADADLNDTVLRSFDASTTPPAITDLCPVTEAVVSGGRVAFLRPETAGPVATAGCSQPNADLNGDGDTSDLIVQERPAAGGPVVNHALAAREIAASDTALAALVSEADQFGQNLNGDGDADDLVLSVFADATGWTSTGLAGDAIGVSGGLVALAATEADQGQDLNADGDQADRVLYLVDAATGVTANTGQSVAEFVAGAGFVAFRTRECDESGGETDGCASGGTDLNGDGDAADAVLQVWVSTGSGTGFVHSTGLAAVTCDFEACDPRFPYRVAGSTITFLTVECQQGGPVAAECAGGGSDLNGDGDAGDLVLQVLNVDKIEAPTQTIAATSAGVCTSTGAPCAFDADCGTGTCFVPPGACVLDLGTACTPGSCPTGQYCQAPLSNPLILTCHQAQGPCADTSECTAPALCVDVDQQLQRVVAPLASAVVAGDETSGAQVFASNGICRESLGTPCVPAPSAGQGTGCQAGEACLPVSPGSSAGVCYREHGSCQVEADCAAGACTQDLLITATAADADGDSLADPIDNCPDVANPDQADADTDAIGDACDPWTCGDGVRDGTPGQAGIEECDDGNLTPGDGCDATCQLEAPDCSDGFDNDGDGKTDYGVGPTNDPGCSTSLTVRENPQCSNGVDDDFDGQVDYPADPTCQNVRDNDERTNPSCGLGVELLLALPILAALRRRKMRLPKSAG